MQLIKTKNRPDAIIVEEHAVAYYVSADQYLCCCYMETKIVYRGVQTIELVREIEWDCPCQVEQSPVSHKKAQVEALQLLGVPADKIKRIINRIGYY